MDAHFRNEAVLVALVCESPDELRRLAIAECVHVPQLIDHVTMLYKLPETTVEELLTHDDATVVSHALRGLWHAREKYPLPASLRTTWLNVATKHLSDEWCLQQALKADEEFRLLWLADQCANADRSSRYRRDKDFQIATSDLTEEQRFQLLLKVTVKSSCAAELVRAIVGDLPSVYVLLLKIQDLEQLHGSPLVRHPDSVWVALFMAAVQNGMTTDNVVYESRRFFTMDFAEVPDKFHREIKTWTELKQHQNSGIANIARIALKLAKADLEHWTERDRRDQLR